MSVPLPAPDSALYQGIVAALQSETPTRAISKLYKVGQGVVQGVAKASGIAADGVGAHPGTHPGAHTRTKAKEAPMADTLEGLQPAAADALPVFVEWTLEQLKGRDGRGPKGMDPRMLEYHLKNLRHAGELCPETLVKVRGGDDEVEDMTDEAVVEALMRMPPRLLREALTKMGGGE